MSSKQKGPDLTRSGRKWLKQMANAEHRWEGGRIRFYPLHISLNVNKTNYSHAWRLWWVMGPGLFQTGNQRSLLFLLQPQQCVLFDCAIKMYEGGGSIHKNVGMLIEKNDCPFNSQSPWNATSFSNKHFFKKLGSNSSFCIVLQEIYITASM